MFHSLKERKPAAAATIGILAGPVIGMLYVNRGKLALEYLIVLILVTGAPFLAAQYDILSVDPRLVANILGLAILILGAFHCHSVAKKGVGNLKWYTHWYILILPFLFAIVFREGFYHPYHIASSSMSPTINAGDYLFANLRAYDSHTPQRGDVVVFRPQAYPSVLFIKRIIGMPGDHVQLRNGIVYINNVALSDRQIGSYIVHDIAIPRFIETLPGGREIDILKQSSNRETDNTPVYQVPADNYFVLGDNRDGSRDSRFRDFGYVPEQNIIGKAGPVLWNTETYKISYRPIN